MSAGRPRREVAHRLFAAEFDDATVSIADSDEEMAPTYVLIPSGALVNRAFVVGVLTSVDQVGDDIYRGRINDPTATFIAYAGQYQPKAANVLADAETPMFVALTAKARTFQPEGSDRVLSSLRPERVIEASVAARDRWVAETARHTLARIELFARARAADIAPAEIEAYLLDLDVQPALAAGIARAAIEYDTSATYLKALRQRVVEALEVVFEDREAVTPLELAPDAPGEATFASLATEAFVDVFRGADAARMAPLEAVAPADEAADDGDPVPAAPTVEADATVADDPPAPSDLADVEAGAEPEPPDDLADLDALADLDEQYELSDAERTEVEEEFGTEFATGDEVESPEEPAGAPEPPAEPDAEAADPAADEVDDADLETVVTEHMRDLDESDGVDRGALVEAVAAETGATVASIDDAIQDALMSGTCYEPEEGRLKPI